MKMALFAASINTRAPEIDLHESNSLYDAMELLESELFALQQEGQPHCRIIHGIGSGVLQEATHALLETHPMVVAWEQEISGGSTIAIFYR